MNCSLIFKSKRQYIVHFFFFFFFFSLTIKDKTKISLMIKILHLGQGSFTRKVRTNFTLKIIVNIFVKLFLILVLHLRQFFIVRMFVKRATGVWIAKGKFFWPVYVLVIVRRSLVCTSVKIINKISNKNIRNFQIAAGFTICHMTSVKMKIKQHTKNTLKKHIKKIFKKNMILL